jgi:acyl-coenzyme A thioesterase PaaI-like protein
MAEIHDVADAMRLVMDRMVGTTAPPDVFGEVASALRDVADRLGEYRQSPAYVGFAEAANADSPVGPFDNSPLLGAANPVAPPLRLRVEDDRVVGTARFGSAYEGPPGCVHGGLVAAAFDELLGLAQSLGGNPGMTARLVVQYRSPTPLHAELQLEGRLERVEGRKTFCVGTIHADGRLCAEAEGLFVAMTPDRFQQLMADRDHRA